MSAGEDPIRSWAAKIPLACYFGASLIVLGVLAGDWRGIFVGLLLVVIAPVAVSYHGRR